MPFNEQELFIPVAFLLSFCPFRPVHFVFSSVGSPETHLSLLCSGSRRPGLASLAHWEGSQNSESCYTHVHGASWAKGYRLKSRKEKRLVLLAENEQPRKLESYVLLGRLSEDFKSKTGVSWVTLRA